MKILNRRNRSQEDLPRPISICRGAEAVITLYEKEGGNRFLSNKSESISTSCLETPYVVKERVKKSYRIPELDEQIRKQRTNTEASLYDRARRAGIAVPLVRSQKGYTLVLEYINGKKLKDVLNTLDKKEVEEVSKKIGEIAGKLHSAGIVHGDLTTSNLILKENTLYVIDFGLGKTSNRVEDQATDLYLLYEALRATHFKILELCWKNILDSYSENYENSKEVMKRLEEVSKRRRYKMD